MFLLDFSCYPMVDFTREISSDKDNYFGKLGKSMIPTQLCLVEISSYWTFLAIPKSVTLHFSPSPTRTFLAAKSRWIIWKKDIMADIFIDGYFTCWHHIGLNAQHNNWFVSSKLDCWIISLTMTCFFEWDLGEERAFHWNDLFSPFVRSDWICHYYRCSPFLTTNKPSRQLSAMQTSSTALKLDWFSAFYPGC